MGGARRYSIAPPVARAGRSRQGTGSTRWSDYAHRDDRHRLCGPRLRRLLFRLRSCRDVRRQGCRQDRCARAGRDADLRTRAGPARRLQRARRSPVVHHRSRRRSGRGGRGVHRGRYSLPARRRTCRPVLRLRRHARDRPRHSRAGGGRHQVHRAGRHRRRSGTHPPRGSPSREGLRRLQPGIPPRGRGDRRLQATGPGGDRHRGRGCAPGHDRDLPAALPSTTRPCCSRRGGRAS